ncbi:hypothetical protein Taro_017466 [Colocasia esculenta]|uniref:Uncharacterized protein n=1 Tax=Colocasia esculenta TaxID=4460 RepID=A0A843UNP4_COLES|nr:hypothetical protein [Colocasia esculenta]
MARSNNKKECSSKPLTNIPRIPVDNPAMVAQSQKYQLEIEMLRKQIQEKEAYILASKEMEGLVETLQRYNPLVDHVGIHGQRRLTEALNKDSLVRRKEYPTESSSKSRNVAPCPGVHDMHHTEAMRNVTRGPTVCRSLSSRCTYSNRPIKPMADRLRRQGISEADPNMAEEAISATKLHAISQGGEERARDYIRRWMNVCRKYKQPLSEEDTVNICKNNLQKEILNRMGGIDIRTFNRLNSVATDIEAFLTKYFSPDTGGQRKRHVHILEVAKGEASSSLDKLSRRRKIIPLKEKMKKPYSFPKR